MDTRQFAASSIAGRRKQNQDACLTSPELGLCVVADGMGGYAGGEVASQTAVEVIHHFFESNRTDAAITWPFGMNRQLSLAENMVSVGVRLADQAIAAKRRGKLAQMGTTVVVAAFDDDEVVLGHVGDSRIYRLRDDTLVQLTRDHSMYNDLVDAGCEDLGPPEKFAHKNIVSRALGFAKTAEEPPELRREKVEPGDIFLLCTDGLHDVLPATRIASVLGVLGPQDACDRLLEEALEAGSTDNITAAIVEVNA